MAKKSDYISKNAEKAIKRLLDGVTTSEEFDSIYAAFKDVNKCLETTNHFLFLDYDSETETFTLYDNGDEVTNYIEAENISQEVYSTLGILSVKREKTSCYSVLYASKYSDEDSIYIECLGNFETKEKAIACVEKSIKEDIEENENCKFIQDNVNGTWVSDGRSNDYHLMTYKIQKIR